MFFSGSQGKLVLIIDVQSSIVRGTLVLTNEGQKVHIISTDKVHIPYKPDGGSAYLIKMALEASEEIIGRTRVYLNSHHTAENVPHSISAVHYVLSSPWIVSQAKTLSVSFKDDMTITQPYITGMIWEERAKMVSSTTDDVRIIEEKVFDVRLNGYSVASWESKHTRELGVSFIVSLAGGRMIDRFVDTASDLVKSSRVFFHSSLFLQHVGIQTVLPSFSTYALIHVHGELTDIAVIKSRSCTFFGSYPFGVHTIIRKLAEGLKTTDASAESTFAMLVKGDLDRANAAREFEVLDDLGSLWVRGLKELLATDTHAETLPGRIVVSSHSMDDFFKDILHATYTEATIEQLSIDEVSKHVTYDPSVDRLRLSGLYALAIHSI